MLWTKNAAPGWGAPVPLATPSRLLPGTDRHTNMSNPPRTSDTASAGSEALLGPLLRVRKVHAAESEAT